MSSVDPAKITEFLNQIGKDVRRMRVLIVDRHSSARNSLRFILSSLGISTVHNAGTTA